jgi:hypothetical protein
MKAEELRSMGVVEFPITLVEERALEGRNSSIVLSSGHHTTGQP